jgi:hypothetical protein
LAELVASPEAGVWLPPSEPAVVGEAELVASLEQVVEAAEPEVVEPEAVQAAWEARRPSAEDPELLQGVDPGAQKEAEMGAQQGV